jgi:cell division protein FtsA
MGRREVIVGIDIGSHKVATVVARAGDKAVDIIGVGVAESLGVRKGMIVDLEETISSLSASLEEAERMSGVPIRDAVVSVSGQHVEFDLSKGLISTLQSGGEVTAFDIERVLDAAKANGTPPNKDIIHALPRVFAVDGQPGIKDPLGMQCVRLEVEAMLITGATGVLKNEAKALHQAGVEVREFCFTPIAASYAVTTKKQRENGVIVLDMGAQTTHFAIFEEDQILSAGCLPLGGANVTNDLAIGLRTTIDVAERIKKEVGQAGKLHGGSGKADGAPYGFEGTLDLGFITEIIDARLNELFMMAREQLRLIGRDGLLPVGAILTGGASQQAGLVSLAKEGLKLPATKGEVVQELSGMVDNVSDASYATCVGLAIMALEKNFATSPRPSLSIAMPGGLKDAFSKAKGLFKNLLP